MFSDRERFIALNLVPGIGSASLRRLLEAFGGLDRLVAAGAVELQEAAGLHARSAERLAAACRDERALRRELALTQRAGVAILTQADEGYPVGLRTIPDPPLALYVKGIPEAMTAPAVAIVGSRRASFYGLECAERLACELALRGVTIVSGLARGIDGAAHRGALKAGGRTIAVLGHGLSQIYPPEHERLANAVAASGWLVSEYPMDAAPLAHHFPRRNRLISGWSLGVVVVEAAARSGALITVDCALEQGREVFAVPGPMTAVTSQGTHHLLKQGARLVTSVEDILEELRLVPLGGGAPVAGEAPASVAGPATGVRGKNVTDPSTRAPARLASPNEAAGGIAHLVPSTALGARQDSAPRAGSQVPRAMPVGLHSTAVAGELAEAETRVLACVEVDPRTIDAIALESGLGIPEVASLLLQLEVKHLVRQLPGKRFVKVAQGSGLGAGGKRALGPQCSDPEP